jgi:hypothetical protein
LTRHPYHFSAREEHMATLPAGQPQEEEVPDFPPIEEPANPGDDENVIILDPEVIEDLPSVPERRVG